MYNLSFKKKKIGWNTLNKWVSEDSPRQMYLMRIHNFINEEPSFTKYVDIAINYEKYGYESIEAVKKEFMRHIIITCQNGPETASYRHKDAKGRTVWQTAKTAELKKSFIGGLFNSSYGIIADSITFDRRESILFHKNDKIFLNLCVKSQWTLQKLLDWRKSTEYDAEEEKIARERIDYHFNIVICRENEKDREWLYQCIANCLFNDDFKPPIMPILFSKMTGSGKTSFIKKIFEKYFGPEFGIKDDTKYADKGSLNVFLGKRFVLLDEFQVETLQDYNKLKTLISEDTIGIENKP